MKNLGFGKSQPSARMTRCFTEFSLRSPRPKGVGSEAEWVQHDIHMALSIIKERGDEDSLFLPAVFGVEAKNMRK